MSESAPSSLKSEEIRKINNVKKMPFEMRTPSQSNYSYGLNRDNYDSERDFYAHVLPTCKITTEDGDHRQQTTTKLDS